MRIPAFFIIVTALLLLMITLAPKDSQAKRIKLKRLKKIAAVALLLKGQKRFIFPVPVPLPFPMPVVRRVQPVIHKPPQHVWPHQAWPIAEPWPTPAWSVPEPWVQPYAYAEPWPEPTGWW